MKEAKADGCTHRMKDRKCMYTARKGRLDAGDYVAAKYIHADKKVAEAALQARVDDGTIEKI